MDCDQNLLLLVPSGPLRVSIKQPCEKKTTPYSVCLSIIIPTYNEQGNIERLVQTLSHLLDTTLPDNYELIIVDDDSPDRTWNTALTFIHKYPHLKVMRRQHEKGLSTAVIRGWQAAQGDILGVIDGDLQHPPHTLLELLKAIQEGADLAVASRHCEGGGVSSWSLTRRFLSRGAQVLGLVILPRVIGRVSDPMSGYFMLRRSCIEGATLSPLGYKILLEVIGRGQVKEVAEVGYVFSERTEGESKVTWKQYVDYVRHLIRLRASTRRLGSLKGSINLPVNRFTRFGLVGLSGVFVDMTILYLLSDSTMLGLPLTRSKIFAAEIAVINNFLWNDAWTFADVVMQQQQWHKRAKRFLKFNVICLAGLIVNVLVLNLIFNIVISNQYIANLVAIAVATTWNFWINLKLNWRITEVK